MRGILEKSAAVLVFLVFTLSFFVSFVAADPDGVDITLQSNETRASTSAYNLSGVQGGYIATFNITATTQNNRWKGFVGQVSGTFTLDDATGSTIFDWSSSTVGGEVYTTRNSSTITWSNVTCASSATLEVENTAMSHTNADDNITITFSDATHDEFFIGNVNITTDTCPTLNTYIGNVTQQGSFGEVALYEALGGNIIYATLMETNVVGFDGNTYDFQMIVPENGGDGFSGSTAYYLYVELS